MGTPKKPDPTPRQIRERARAIREGKPWIDEYGRLHRPWPAEKINPEPRPVELPVYSLGGGDFFDTAEYPDGADW